MNEASRGQNSPYAALSAFAIDPVYLALDALEDFDAAGGVDALSREDRALLAAVRASPSVRWHEVRALKGRALELAFRALRAEEWGRRTARARALEAFARAGRRLARRLRALRRAPRRRARRPRAGRSGPRRCATATPTRSPRRAPASRARILFHTWLQWQLDEQWHAARARGERRRASSSWATCPSWWPPTRPTSGPAASTSASTRASASRPTPSAPTGQDWGLPVYRWDVMERNGLPLDHRARAPHGRALRALPRGPRGRLLPDLLLPERRGQPAFVPERRGRADPERRAGARRSSRRARGSSPRTSGPSRTSCATSLEADRDPGLPRAPLGAPWDDPGQPFRDPAGVARALGRDHRHARHRLAGRLVRRRCRRRSAARSSRCRSSRRSARAAPTRFDDEVRDALLELVYGSGSDLLLLPFQDAFGHAGAGQRAGHGERRELDVPDAARLSRRCTPTPRRASGCAGSRRAADGSGRLGRRSAGREVGRVARAAGGEAEGGTGGRTGGRRGARRRAPRRARARGGAGRGRDAAAGVHLPAAAPRGLRVRRRRARSCRTSRRSASPTSTSRRCSPPRPGSTHGYDVVDHARLSPGARRRGGLRAPRGGVPPPRDGASSLDFVPNHMGIGPREPLVDGRPRERPVLGLGAAPSTSTGRRSRPSSTTRCSCRCSATSSAACSSAASSSLAREGGALVVRYFDARVPGRAALGPARAPPPARRAARRARRRATSAPPGARVDLRVAREARAAHRHLARRRSRTARGRRRSRSGGSPRCARRAPAVRDVRGRERPRSSTAARASRAASTCSSGSSTRRPTGSPSGASRARRSTTGASST